MHDISACISSSGIVQHRTVLANLREMEAEASGGSEHKTEDWAQLPAAASRGRCQSGEQETVSVGLLPVLKDCLRLSLPMQPPPGASGRRLFCGYLATPAVSKDPGLKRFGPSRKARLLMVRDFQPKPLDHANLCQHPDSRASWLPTHQGLQTSHISLWI